MSGLRPRAPTRPPAGLAYSRPLGSGGTRKNSPKTRAGNWESVIPRTTATLCLGRCCLTLLPSAEGLGGSRMSPQGRKWVDRGPGPRSSVPQRGPGLSERPCAQAGVGAMSVPVSLTRRKLPRIAWGNTRGVQPGRVLRQRLGVMLGRIEVRTPNPKEASVHPPSAVWQGPGCTQLG